MPDAPAQKMATEVKGMNTLMKVAITIVIVGPGIWLVLWLAWMDGRVRSRVTTYKNNVR